MVLTYANLETCKDGGGYRVQPKVKLNETKTNA